MKYLVALSLFYGCSQLSKKEAPPQEELVSLTSAIDHAQMSYLRGCVEAFVSVKIPGSFESCRDKAILHRREVESIIYQPIPNLKH